MASGLLPKSPVSSSLCDEVPRIFIPKSHLEPREFLISSAKRLLQQYRHLAAFAALQKFGRYWTNSGQRSASAPNGSVAIDPKQTAATEMPHRGANFSPRHADEIPSLQME